MGVSAIERIRAMQSNGTISEEQAEELIAALGDQATADRPSEGYGGSSEGDHDAPGPANGYRYEYRYEWEGGRASGWSGQTTSRVDQPKGEDFQFDDNRIVFSRLHGLRLVRAKVTGNAFSATSLKEAEITDGAMQDCAFAGAALHDLRIDGGTMKDVSLKGCKVHTLLIGKESLIRDMRIVGSVLTRLTLERTQLRDSRIKGSLVSDTVFADAELSSCDFRGTRFQGTEVRASRLKDCRFDGMGFRDLRMSGSTLRNVSFRETHSELPRVAEGLSIVDSTLGNIEFIGCAFRNTTIRGIKVEGLRLRGADLSDRTIEMVEDLRALAER